MDSDILLRDDGTAEVTGDRFKASVTDIQMFYRGGHLTTANGSVELCSDSSTLKMAASDFELYYTGGHLVAKGKRVELGSTDSGTLKGFAQAADGSVGLTGDEVRIDAVNTAAITGHVVRCNSWNANSDGSFASAVLHMSGAKLHAEAGKTAAAASTTFAGSSTLDLSRNKFQVEAPAVQLGSRASGSFIGVSLSASGLTCNVPALCVLNPSVPARDGQQRLALMQDAADELVLNAAGHYTGGTRVEGRLSLPGEVVAGGEIKVGTAAKLLLQQPDRVVKTTTVPPRTMRIPGQTLDVLQTLVALQTAVHDLTTRLAALESQPR